MILVAELIYQWISRNRHLLSRAFGCKDACALLPAKKRQQGQARLSHLETSVTFPQSRLDAALAKATRALLAELGADGHWSGELSKSALSTATAVVALTAVDRAQNDDLIAGGLRWLAAHQNSDGGWGDTVKSRSNISTTALCWAALCWAALRGAAQAAEFAAQVQNGAAWLTRAAGSMVQLVRAFARHRAPLRQGPHFFGADPHASRDLRACPAGRWLPALPFELAALPHQLFGALQLPFVSYALPALIAIGQAIHLSRAVAQSAGADDPPSHAGAHAAHSRNDPAGERRISGSHALDEFRHHGPRFRGPGETRGSAKGSGVFTRQRARGWKLGDRYESGHVGHDSRDQSARVSAGRAFARAAIHAPRMVARPAILRRASLHARCTRRLGLDRFAGRRARRRRYARRTPRLVAAR